MAKAALKKAIYEEQGGLDPRTGEALETDQSLNDTDRKQQKKDGGTYTTRANVQLLKPLSHMARHGILREREEALDTLKSLFDDRVQMMKLLLKENNQLLAYERRVDHQHPETAEFLREHLKPIQKRLDQIDKSIATAVKSYPDPLVQIALKVPGIGPITVAALTVYIDLDGVYSEKDRAVIEGHKVEGTEKARHASQLWRYVGLDVPAIDRYTKGEAGGGNKTLRTVLWNTANVMMKLGDKSEYRKVYDRTKTRLAASEKIVKSRNTQGKLVEIAWKDTKPSHRHGAALRAIIKHLLADYWLVGRTLAGLSTEPLYAESMLGHQSIIQPRERGWEY